MIFQGPPTSRSFVHNIHALQDRKYFNAGMLVAVSLANGGPGFTCLADVVYNYFCYGLEMRVTPTVSDILDIEMQQKLQKVNSTYTCNTKQWSLIESVTIGMLILMYFWRCRLTLLLVVMSFGIP